MTRALVLIAFYTTLCSCGSNDINSLRSHYEFSVKCTATMGVIYSQISQRSDAPEGMKIAMSRFHGSWLGASAMAAATMGIGEEDLSNKIEEEANKIQLNVSEGVSIDNIIDQDRMGCGEGVVSKLIDPDTRIRT